MKKTLFAIGLAVFVLSFSALAQETDDAKKMKDMKDKMMSEHNEGMQDAFVESMVAQFSGLQKKFASLAAAFPADKLTWRPAEGVRSVREVLTHIADANTMFLMIAGLKGPDGPALPKDQKERENRFTTNDELVKAINASFENAIAQVKTMTHKQIHAEANLFGQKTTNMNALIVSVGHLHEHLGQSIAYARTNGVVPPWNAK